MFLYLQNEITYSIKFDIVIKLVMSFKTSEKEIWHNMHGSCDERYLKRWNFKNET